MDPSYVTLFSSHVIAKAIQNMSHCLPFCFVCFFVCCFAKGTLHQGRHDLTMNYLLAFHSNQRLSVGASNLPFPIWILHFHLSKSVVSLVCKNKLLNAELFIHLDRIDKSQPGSFLSPTRQESCMNMKTQKWNLWPKCNRSLKTGMLYTTKENPPSRS